MKSQQRRRNEVFELESLRAKPHIQNKSQGSGIDYTFRTKIFSITILILVICVMSIIPIIKMIIGIIHYDDCTIRSSIPIYMITSGLMEIVISFPIALNCSLAGRAIRESEKMETSCGRCCAVFWACFASCVLVTCMIILYTIIMLILMIIGSIIIFPVKRTVQFSNPNALEYCHPTLYNCAFWTLIAYYAIFALSLMSILGICLSIYLDDRKK